MFVNTRNQITLKHVCFSFYVITYPINKSHHIVLGWCRTHPPSPTPPDGNRSHYNRPVSLAHDSCLSSPPSPPDLVAPPTCSVSKLARCRPTSSLWQPLPQVPRHHTRSSFYGNAMQGATTAQDLVSLWGDFISRSIYSPPISSRPYILLRICE
jgi:hypothetical protein